MSEPRRIGMRVSLAGVVRQAADQLARLAADVRGREGYDPERPDREDESGDVIADPCPEADSLVFMLRQLERHIDETRAGQHSIEQFAEFYCLTERKS